MTNIAIVILNWNGKDYLAKFLPLLYERTQMPGIEIIVADNASSDGSMEFMKRNFSDTRLIQLEKNHGFAGGYNKALEQVEANYFLLLNSDIEVRENWLQPLAAFMEGHRETAACSPVLLDYYHRDKYEYAGAAGGYIDRLGYTFCRGRLFHTTETRAEAFNTPVEVFWTTGACMMIRASLFREAGGFDENFFAHMEEVDLCWRLKNMGYKLAIVPESNVFHVGGGTLPKSNPFKTYLNFRNNLFLLYKNLPEKGLVSTIRKRMLLDGVSAIMFLATLKFKDFKAVIRAHAGFRKKREEYKKYRADNRTRIIKSDHPEIYPGSVVFDYFIAGRKHFGSLRGHYSKEMDQRIIGITKIKNK
ncbi:MAG: glycosyltransferase family 2 protein [Bacteroidales bacterium]